jgi:hypothetical protein
MEKGTRLVYNSARNLLARYTRLNAASIKYFHTPSMAVSTYRSVSQAKPLVGSKYASYLWKRSFATGKDLRFATEARNLMLKGVDSLADAVEVGRRLAAERRNLRRIICCRLRWAQREEMLSLSNPLELLK